MKELEVRRWKIEGSRLKEERSNDASKVNNGWSRLYKAVLFRPRCPELNASPFQVK
jgi:hypothetical protein